MTTQWYSRVGIGIVGLMLTGCATIVNGAHQDLTITSQPSALCVTVDGQAFGPSPVVASLRRAHPHTVKVEWQGYTPFEMTVTPVVSSMIWGNAILGGPIGLLVDGVTESGYELAPLSVHAFFPTAIGQGLQQRSMECPLSELALEQQRSRLSKTQLAKTMVDVRSGYIPYTPNNGSH
ncbi:PEGA domain-containing protein [Nitrospira sp. CMX1]